MRTCTFLLASLTVSTINAQSSPPPVDPLPKVTIDQVGYWQNGGQVVDLEDAPLNDFKFCSDGVLPRTGFLEGGHLAFVREILATDSLSPTPCSGLI